MSGGRDVVTGGAGFIGSHLVDALVVQGRAVTVLDDFSTGSRANLAPAVTAGDVRIVEGSILDAEAVTAALEGGERVFHLAVQCVRRSLGRPRENHDVNATGTLAVLEAARRARISRFIYCSSSEVYGNTGCGRLAESTLPEPVTVYGAAKLAGELYTKAYHRTYGLPAVIVRPFNCYGPREHHEGDLGEVIPRFLIRVLNGQPPVIFGDGRNGRDFTYVADTARGIALAAGCDAAVGRVVNLAYGRMITIAEVAQAVATVCGRPDIAPLLGEVRPGDVNILQADTALACSLLGFRAATPFEEGLRLTLDWFRRNWPDPSVLAGDELRNWSMPPMP